MSEPESPSFGSSTGSPWPAPTLPRRRRPLLGVVVVVAVAVVAAGVTVMLLRGGGDSPSTGSSAAGSALLETSGRVGTDGSYVAVSVRLDPGQVFRVRAEPSDDLDTDLVLVVDRATAQAIADTVWPELVAQGNAPGDADPLEWLFWEAQYRLTEGAAAEDYRGQFAINLGARGWAGEPDTSHFVAFGAGNYTVVAHSDDGSGTARLLLEVWDQTIDLDRELPIIVIDPDRFFERLSPWFTEPAFFDDPLPYRPGNGSTSTPG